MTYEMLLAIHVSCAILSVSGFFLRGVLMLRDSPLLNARWVRTLPHVNDSVLLAAAITLALWSGQYPFVQAWLSAKVLGLLAYIGFGAVALRPTRPKGVRVVSFVLALLTVSWLVSVALTRQPQGFFSRLI